MNDLQRLARHHGIAPTVTDGFGRRRRVPADVLAGLLSGLDVDARDPGATLRNALRERWSRLCEPVAVAWEGRLDLVVRSPESARSPVRIEVHCEDGAVLDHRANLSGLPVLDRFERGRTVRVARRLRVPQRLPAGYHRATVRLGSRSAEVLVIAAPRRAPAPVPGSRDFGVIAPLYALRSAHRHGIADLGDLRRLVDWTRAHGGAFVGTLPLLAAFLDDPAEISPYRPASRLAWNELYAELPATPEWRLAAGAGELTDPAAAPEAGRLGRLLLADPAAAYALKRPAIDALARRLFSDRGPRRRALAAFESDRPELAAYARFRAAQPVLGRSWRDWPSQARDGTLHDADLSRDEYRAHLYAQFMMDEQLSTLAAHASAGGRGLYLDLPLGAHPDGFDTWRDPQAFAQALGVGAPPDRLFEGGQSWGFPPFHPVRLRDLHYGPFIEVIRNHLRYAGLLRIDHVMGLHRLYLIPPGGAARDGAYVAYAADELWAILVLEASRTGTVLVGEDLGTVPRRVRSTMRRHGVGGMHVLEFAVRPGERPPLVTPPPNAFASLSTHDLSPFAGWVAGDDVRTRRALSFLDDAAAADSLTRRRRETATLARALGLPADPSPEAFLHAALRHLGESAAPLVGVSLDELAGHREAQNVPGTGSEHANWRHRSERDAAALEDPATLEALSVLAEARRRPRSPDPPAEASAGRG